MTLILIAFAVLASLASPLGGSESSTGGAEFLVDRSVEWGLDFVHDNGMSGELYFPEMTGQGGALIDYDGDGDLDVYLVQGGSLPATESSNDKHQLGDRLFRNDPIGLPDGSWRPSFVDVTESSALQASGYGMGIAAGDFDNDGWVDLYITNFGPNQLWHNRGDGTFADVSDEAGVGDPLWGTSATFLDFDRDGQLDLYVVNYVEFDVERNPRCYAPSSRLDYCGPADFSPQPDRLYRNLGDGTFQDVTRAALGGYSAGPGLGVVAADFDNDGWQDLFVANDGEVNQLWINGGDGTFSDQSLIAGVAVNRHGRAEASMGVGAGDIDGDGDEDLFVTHLMGETNTLYLNDGSALFEDRTIEMGLATGSLPFTSFGTAFLDVDSDGWLDLLILSGAVRHLEPLIEQGSDYPLHQSNQLYRNDEGGRFTEITNVAGTAFALSEVSRGAAIGDVDNDGRTDVLISNNNGPARLLINESDGAREWLGARVLANANGSDSIGARIEVLDSTGRRQSRWLRAGGSYCSSNDPRALVALGELAELRAVRITLPGREARQWRGFQANRYWVVPKRPFDRRSP